MKVSVNGFYLELRSAAHQKFYQVLIAENNVLMLRWGRIGAPVGSFTVSVFPSYTDADDRGRKSLFEKKAKGYTEISSRTFQVDEAILDEARRDHVAPLIRAFDEAARKPDFKEQGSPVLGAYEKFAGRVQTLMDKATRGEIDVIDSMEEFQDLKVVWAGIQEMHAEVQTAMNITEMALTQRLLSGAQ